MGRSARRVWPRRPKTLLALGGVGADSGWLDCFDPGWSFEPAAADGRGAMWAGRVLAHGRLVATVTEGVIDLTRTPDASASELEQLTCEGWIARSWRNANGVGGSGVARELAAIRGPICEVAAGPGGGFMPAVRRLNSGARILVNDLSPGVLRPWTRFLAGCGLDPGLGFAAFDATAPVLRPGCMAAVCSLDGFSNVAPAAIGPALDAIRRGETTYAEAAPAGPRPQDQAVESMAAALRRGGVLFAEEGTLDPAGRDDVAPARREEWQRRWSPFLGFAPARAATAAGLRVVRHETTPGRTLDPGEGEVPRDAARFGITLRTQRELVVAVKP